MTHASVSPEERKQLGISDTLVCILMDLWLVAICA